MNINIRQETPADYTVVFKLVEQAFQDMKYSNHDEHNLVERLRKSEAFIPELSLVAELDGDVIGHILLSKVIIKNTEQSFESLSLAPVSVHPDYQKRGIGGKLINQAHQTAASLGYESVVLLGHPEYYPKFGYVPAHQFDINLPFDSPKENCMAIELVEDSLKDVSGDVVYPKVFFG